MIYLLFLGDIYGCVEYELLWYNLFSTTLKGVGLEINSYDICVAKKIKSCNAPLYAMWMTTSYHTKTQQWSQTSLKKLIKKLELDCYERNEKKFLGIMPVKPVVTPMNQDALSFDDKSKSL